MPKNYNLGKRNAGLKRFTEGRYAWCKVVFGEFIILVGDESGESTEDVVLFHPRPSTIPNVTLPLTNLTEEELDAFESIVTSAIAWARPVVKKRDTEAQDAWNNGDDSNPRNYRPVPQLVYRKRPQSEHSEGVHERPEGVREGGGRTSQDDGVRGAGDELAQSGEAESKPEDDQPKADSSEAVRQVDGDQ